LEEPHFEEIDVPLSFVFGLPKEERLWEYPVTQGQPVIALTRVYAHSLSQLPIFHSLPLTAKRKPRIFSINKKTSIALSLEDIVLESLQSIDTPWEKIPEDPLSRDNPCYKNQGTRLPYLDLEDPNEECLEEPSTKTSQIIIFLTFL